MNSANALLPTLVALCGAAVAVYIALYVPEPVRVIAFIALVLCALVYTLVLMVRSNKPRARIRKIWTEVIDALFGL